MTPKQKIINELEREILPKHDVNIRQVLSRLKFHNIVKARDECAYYLFDKYGKSSVQIGLILKRDHTSILHAIGRHCERAGIQSGKTTNYRNKLKRCKDKYQNITKVDLHP